MKISSAAIVIIVIVVLVGGVIFTNVLNLWDKPPIDMSQIPASTPAGDNCTEAAAKPDFSTPYQPAEIRGTNTFAEISMMFNVPLDDLGTGFAITSEPNWQNLKARELKAIYTNLPADVKLETESVRAFISLYTGKDYNYSTSAYLLQPAVDILKQKAELTSEQVAYLDSHIYTPGTSVATGTADANKHTVTGETSFGTLLSWGIPADEIERAIQGKMPASNTFIRDYASQQGKDFLALISVLQELANQY
ncbi:hypothetical protein ACFLYM_02655 [Chloroflexota bacterium]